MAIAASEWGESGLAGETTRQQCVTRAFSLGMLVASMLMGCKSIAPRPQVPQTDHYKTDKYYADPGTPNIAGVWRTVRDGYKPLVASDNQLASGVKLGTASDNGLPPGTMPRDVWIVDGKPLPGNSPGGPWIGIPYTPKWQAAYDKRVADNRQGKVYGNPHFDCLPRGAMGSYSGGPNAFTITQTPGRVQMIFFEEQVGLRNIYTDGRKHASWSDADSADFEPTPYGHSIGHWEGGTLVVDVVGIDRAYTLGFLGMHSSRFHMIERFSRISDIDMDIDIIVDDKVALLKPMAMKIRYRLQAGQDYKEETCTNNRNVTDTDGVLQTLTKPKKGAGWDLPEE